MNLEHIKERVQIRFKKDDVIDWQCIRYINERILFCNLTNVYMSFFLQKILYVFKSNSFLIDESLRIEVFVSVFWYILKYVNYNNRRKERERERK